MRTGLAGHSSQPHLGHNAVLAAAKVIVALDDEHHALQAKTSPLGPPTLTTTLASGGVALNIVPPAASVSIDRRVVVGETATAVLEDIIAIARTCAHAHDPHIGVDAKV